MLRLLLGKDWTANRAEILGRIASDVRQKKGNRILLVPELVTHETERALCAAAGDTSSRFAEVLSFTRLARRVAQSVGYAAAECLDDGGRVVAMASAARQLSSKLKAYAAVETKPEFLTGLIDGIDEFKRCCITPEDLSGAANQTEGSLAQKLEELSLIMDAYDALCAQGKADPRDQMTWLLEQLEEGTFAQEHVFYIDGFPDFTRQNLAIIQHLILCAQEVTVSFNCDEPGSGRFAFEKAGSTAAELYRWAAQHGIKVVLEKVNEPDRPLRLARDRLFQGAVEQGAEQGRVSAIFASSPYQAVLDAALRVRTLVMQGNRYRDISLVCTDSSVYTPLVDLVFKRFQIPVYRAGTEEILNKSVINTVLTALDAALCDFDQKLMMRYLRSALSPLDSDSCDEIENYAIIWGIQGKKWCVPWENHPDGLGGNWDNASRESLEKLNKFREMAVIPLEKLRSGFLSAHNVSDQVKALYDFLVDISLEGRLSALADEMDQAGDNRNAQILNQLWDILISALDQLYSVLGHTKWESDHFSRLFRLLLSQYHVGTIPPVLDAVQMGQFDAMRCHQQKHLIVLGAEEGKLPGYSGSSGVLTDQERDALRNIGVPLTGGSSEGIQAEFADIYGVFCGATETIAVYSAEEHPSFIYYRLASLSGGEEKANSILGYSLADAQEAGAGLVRWGASEEANRLGLTTAYENWLQKKEYSLGAVSTDGIRCLYGDTLNLSASQIDRQAECRLSYFLKYGLRAKERKPAEVDPAEFGTYVHAVLENTARCIRDLGGFHQVSLDQTLQIAHRFSEEYAQQRFSALESERISYLFRRNIRELDMVVTELWSELKDSLFEPVGFEVNFGSEGGLPAITIPNNSMKARLRGFVDRVDSWDSGGSLYYRVVDYKTGSKDFDYCDVFNGVGLQMLLYLFALREDGSDLLGDMHAVPAGVQYFPARAPYLPADGHMDSETADKARNAQWKRRGLLLNDEAVLHAMEPAETPCRSFSLLKDGSISGDLADRESLIDLERYIFVILSEMVDDIASGNVTPNPYMRGSSHSACAFCPYGCICRNDGTEGCRNYKSMSAQRFWEELERRLGRNGR